MNVRFHPPQDQAEYAERVFTLLLQAALPQIMTQLVQDTDGGRGDSAGEGAGEVFC